MTVKQRLQPFDPHSNDFDVPHGLYARHIQTDAEAKIDQVIASALKRQRRLRLRQRLIFVVSGVSLTRERLEIIRQIAMPAPRNCPVCCWYELFGTHCSVPGTRDWKCTVCESERRGCASHPG
jgi:hypothetical protein